jgi:hypothetical protein
MNDEFVMNDAIRLEAPRIGPEGYDPFWDTKKGRYYDRRGNQISFRESSMLWALDEKYRIIKQEYVGDYWVSTVWLGLDHSFGHGPPLIFETMVFNHTLPKPPRPPTNMEIGSPEMEQWLEDYPEQTSASDLDMERYSTESDALEGHARMVEKVRLIAEATDE